ncbi:MAG: response regulator [Acidobacteriota bacterium]
MRAQRSSRNVRKLLVIDDDLRLLASYRDLLAPYGFEILTAVNGENAIVLLEENPDVMLVILDVLMPTMDGKQWLRWYHQQKKECPVIVISAYKFTEADVDLVPTAILEKPFHVAEFLDLVGLFCGLGTPVGSFIS